MPKPNFKVAMHAFLEFKTEDFMSTSGITIRPDTTIEEAESFFVKHDFNLLPVVENGRLVAVLTKTDLLGAFRFDPSTMVPRYEEVARRPIRDVMTKNPFAFAPTTPLTRVLERMVEMRHRSFPVVEDGRLVGIISREDVVRALRKAAGR